jgi:predicted acylesterase/phospholipase RssA
MASEIHESVQRERPRPPFDVTALVLQGGGALGAYQAGVYQVTPLQLMGEA